MTDEISYHALFRVSMRHIDFFGHVHNSVYLDYCQDAVVEYLQKNDLYADFSHQEGTATYLVKKIEVTFQRPLQVEDTVGAAVSVTRIGGSSLTFEIRLDQAKDRLTCAVGQIIWVCVDRETGRARPMLPDILVKLRALTA